MYGHSFGGLVVIKTRAISSGDASIRSGIVLVGGLPTGRLDLDVIWLT